MMFEKSPFITEVEVDGQVLSLFELETVRGIVEARIDRIPAELIFARDQNAAALDHALHEYGFDLSNPDQLRGARAAVGLFLSILATLREQHNCGDPDCGMSSAFAMTSDYVITKSQR